MNSYRSIVTATTTSEAWSKVLGHFDFGDRIRAVEFYEILTDDREIS